MKTLAIIVCRKDSQRIPNKTWRQINGKSLLQIKIEQLRRVPSLDGIVVGSNCELVEDYCKNIKIDFIRRPDYYCDEQKCNANNMIKNMLEYVECDVVLWAHLTNPFIDHIHYQESLDIFMNGKHDSVFSASEIRSHMWSNDGQPINHDPWSSVHKPARDLKPLYRQNGGIFVRHKEQMQADGRFIGDSPYMYVMTEKHGWDIDEQWQLDFAGGSDGK